MTDARTTASWTPAWVRDAVFYQIFPDRFASSARVPKPGPLEPWDSPPTTHGFKGGDLLGNSIIRGRRYIHKNWNKPKLHQRSNGGGEPDRKKLAEDYPALAARI